MKKFFTLSAVLLIFSLLAVFPVKAQITQVTQVTQTTNSANASQPTISVVPGVFNLFFRDISQRMQLLWTIDPAQDAALRFEFANDNVKLVDGLMRLTSDPAVINRAKNLVNRATALVGVVKSTEDRWSRGDTAALNAISARSQEYFQSAQDLVAFTRTLSDNSEWRTSLSDTLETLMVENEKTRTSVQELAKVKNETNSSTAISDKDSDGVEDADELALGLSTSDFDTDNDGLSDRAELERFGTDPTKADTDGDGYRDGIEIMRGFNPVGTGNFSTTTLKKDGFVFVKSKMVLPTLSPATLKLLQEASEGKKIERRHNGTSLK